MAGGKENMLGIRKIVESALALWTASTIENQELFDAFMVWQSKNTSEESTIRNSQQLVAGLIYSTKGVAVRESA